MRRTLDVPELRVILMIRSVYCILYLVAGLREEFLRVGRLVEVQVPTQELMCCQCRNRTGKRMDRKRTAVNARQGKRTERSIPYVKDSIDFLM